MTGCLLTEVKKYTIIYSSIIELGCVKWGVRRMCMLAELYTCAQTHPLIFGLTNKKRKIQMNKSQEKLLHWRQMADQEIYTYIIPHIYFHSLINISLWKFDLSIRTLKLKSFDLYHRRLNKDNHNDPSFQPLILLTFL